MEGDAVNGMEWDDMVSNRMRWNKIDMRGVKRGEQKDEK
jgi:hypothetical protein